MALLYRHIRPDTNEVFYIGVGYSIRRAYSKLSRNAHWKNIVSLNKNNYKVDILLDGLSPKEALIKEVEFISLYGRRDLDRGTLCNLTDGGQGNNGYIVSEETRIKIGKNNVKFWLGKKRPELSQMTIDLNKSRVWSQESRNKVRRAKSGRNSELFGKFGKDHHTSKPVLCTTTGIIYEGISDASRKLGINFGHIASVARGLLKLTGHKKYPGGLHFKYIEKS